MISYYCNREVLVFILIRSHRTKMSFLSTEGWEGDTRRERKPSAQTRKEDLSSKRHLPHHPTPREKSGEASFLGVVSNKIHGADKSVSESNRDGGKKKKKEQDKLPGFLSLQEKKKFPLADEGKGPFNNFFSAPRLLPD